VKIDAEKVVTNIVSFEIDAAWMDAGAFQKACAEQGLRFSRYLGNSPRLRAVTHNDVTAADVDAALEIARAVLSKTRAPALSA
jgi:threonine aldolase